MDITPEAVDSLATTVIELQRKLVQALRERDIYKGLADRNELRITALEACLADTEAERDELYEIIDCVAVVGCQLPAKSSE